MEEKRSRRNHQKKQRKKNNQSQVILLAISILFLLFLGYQVKDKLNNNQEFQTDTSTQDISSHEEEGDNPEDGKPLLTVEEYDYNVEAAYAIDLDNLKLLYKKNGSELHAIGSLTKLISLYVIYDAIEAGKLSMDTTIPISQELSDLSLNKDLSNVTLLSTESYYRLDQLIESILIPSANASTLAVAEHLSGSEENFVQSMKDKLHDLGIENFELYTSTGLKAKYQYGSWSNKSDPYAEGMISPKDYMTVIVQFIQDHPEFLEISSISGKNFTVAKDWEEYMENTNLFLPGLDYERSDVYGIKTGNEDKAGRCILSLVKYGDKQILVLTLGAPSEEDRFMETGRLIDDIQAAYP